MLSLRKLRSLGESGDTIVEVLISIAVLSLILGGAYVTTNKSLQGSRSAQERGDALKLVESQVEAVKAIAAGTNSAAVMGSGTPTYFCILNSTTVVSSSSAGCKVNAKGTATTAEPAYNLAITRTNGDTFTVTNTWVSAQQRSNDTLTMVYRVYQ